MSYPRKWLTGSIAGGVALGLVVGFSVKATSGGDDNKTNVDTGTTVVAPETSAANGDTTVTVPASGGDTTATTPTTPTTPGAVQTTPVPAQLPVLTTAAAPAPTRRRPRPTTTVPPPPPPPPPPKTTTFVTPPPIQIGS